MLPGNPSRCLVAEPGPRPLPIDAWAVARVPHAGDLVALVALPGSRAAILDPVAVFVFVIQVGPCL